MDNDPKHTSKVVAKWLKENKVEVLEWPLQRADFIPIEQFVGRPEKACASTHFLWELIVGSLWKATRNV